MLGDEVAQAGLDALAGGPIDAGCLAQIRPWTCWLHACSVFELMLHMRLVT